MKRSGTSSGSAVPLPTGSIDENCRLRYGILRVHDKDFWPSVGLDCATVDVKVGVRMGVMAERSFSDPAGDLVHA
jgi:hypothetical protein